MAQKTFVAGDVLTASDVNTYLMHEGGAWSTWTPTLTQSGTVTCTVGHAVYGRAGRLIYCIFSLTATGTGTGSNQVTVSLPVTAARSGMAVGQGIIYDASATANHTANIALASTTTLNFNGHGVNGPADIRLGVYGFTAALANNDVVAGSFFYEAAS